MVSIIIPTYNCEKYISKCIDSVLQQKVDSIEVIIVNDGSTDGTAKIVDSYAIKDNRIKVFHVENGGASRARNIGLEQAQGDWILFVDADDWVDDDILSRLELTEKSADIIFFGFKRLYDNGKSEECRPVGCSIANGIDDVALQLKSLYTSKEEYFGYTVNKVFKRSIIDKYNIRFIEGLSIREDEVFVLCYCRYVENVQTISFSPYNYRIIDTSLSHNLHVNYRNYQLLIRSERDILKSYSESVFKEAVLGKLFKYYLSSIIECSYGKRAECRSMIDEAIAFYKRNKQHIVAPQWQLLLFGFPSSAIGGPLINLVFRTRNLFKV